MSALEFVPAGGGGIESGTSFPGSPATDALFYRTDLNLIFFYDGTRWLTVNEYTLAGATRTSVGAGLSATSTLVNAPTVSADMYIEDFRASTFVSGTNNGSNFWTVTLDKRDAANAATTIGSVDTTADTGSTWNLHVDAVDEVVAGATYKVMFIIATKTSAPGNLVVGVEVTYRLVGT